MSGGDCDITPPLTHPHLPISQNHSFRRWLCLPGIKACLRRIRFGDPMRLAAEDLIEYENDAAVPLDPESVVLKTPEELASIVSQFALSKGWLDRVRLGTDDRWYERAYHGPDHDIWVISWMPGQSTGFHDHGESAGAFVLATGVLEEHRPGEEVHVVQPGQRRAFLAGRAGLLSNGPRVEQKVRHAEQAVLVGFGNVVRSHTIDRDHQHGLTALCGEQWAKQKG